MTNAEARHALRDCEQRMESLLRMLRTHHDWVMANLDALEAEHRQAKERNHAA